MSKIDFNKQIKNEWFNVVKYGASTASTDNTAAFQAAINAAEATGYGGVVYIPPGKWNVNAQLTISSSYITLRGNARVASWIISSYTISPFLNFPAGGDQQQIIDINFQGPGAGTNFFCNLVDITNMFIKDCSVTGFYNIFSITGSTTGPNVSNCLLNPAGGDAVYVNTAVAGGTWNDCTFYGNNTTTTIAFHLIACVGININNCYTNGIAYGIAAQPGLGAVVGVVQMFNAYFDGYSPQSLYGIYLDPSGGTINTITSYGGAVSGFTIAGVAVGSGGTGTIVDIYFNQLAMSANGGSGFNCSGGPTVDNIFLTDCSAEANSSSVSGTAAGIYVQDITTMVIRGGFYGAGSFGAGVNTQSYGIEVAGGCTNLMIDGVTFGGNVTGAALITGTNTNARIVDCPGYNPVGLKVITPTGSPMTYLTGHTPEVIYLGGTITSVTTHGGVTIAANVNQVIIPAAQNQTFVITYSGSINFNVDVQ